MEQITANISLRMNSMIYRKADLEDLAILVELRKRQLVDEGIEPSIDIDEELVAFFREKMADGSLVEWVVVDQGEIIATAAIVFYWLPPSYTNRSGMKGYVTNMYTRSDYRKRGIATSLLQKLVEEAKARNVSKLWLGASKLGKPVYEQFGFRQMGEWLDMIV